MTDDLEDSFEHLNKICREVDEKITKRLEQYLNCYAEQQELLLKGK